MTLETDTADFLALIAADSDFLAGSEDVADIAEDWRACPFTAEQAEAWMDARAFTAHGASDLHLAGLNPKQCSTRCDTLGETIAYTYCNGDIDLDDARRLIEVA